MCWKCYRRIFGEDVAKQMQEELGLDDDGLLLDANQQLQKDN